MRRVIRTFQYDDDSELQLIGALLAEWNEIWQECCYIGMDEFAKWPLYE